MAYDEGLAYRVRELLSDKSGFVEKKMFGGIGYMLYGNMACGVNKENLVVRVGPDKYQTALDTPFATVFDITGRPMKGWVVVEPAGFESDEMLSEWVQQGVDFALSLPPK